MQQAQETANDLDEGKVTRLQAIALLHTWPDAAARGVIVVTALILAWLTWAHWGNIQVDCGRELYVPTELLRGKLLYRDVWYSYGPLEPYLAAALLWIFGPHLNVFYLFGLTLATACALFSFDIGEMLAGRAVGLTAAVAILLQGFQSSPLFYGSIFNYIFPYAYAAPLGLLFVLLCLLFALRHVLYGNGCSLMFAGLAAGLAVITKQEEGIACYILLAFLLVTEAALRHSARALLSNIVKCAPGLAIAIAVYGWFAWQLGLSFLIDNWVGPNQYFTRIYAPHLYSGSGLRLMPVELTLLTLDAGIAMLLWFWIAKIGAMRAGRFWWRSGVITLFAIGAAAARQFAPRAMFLVMAVLAYPRGMFVIGCAFFMYSLYGLRDNVSDRLLLAKATLGICALALAARVPSQIVWFGYSIFYDVPLLLIFMISLKTCVEAGASSLDATQRRRLTNLLLTAEVLMLAIFVPVHSERTARLETSWGEIYLQPAEAIVAHRIIEFVSEQKRQGQRVVLLPELPIIYAFTGTEAPNRLYTLQPGFLPPSMEAGYIADLERTDPTYILITNRVTGEYSVPYFGIDYDEQVYHWIDVNYHVAGEFGHFRRDGSRLLTALIYRRNRPSERD
jgi:hypothetical protein